MFWPIRRRARPRIPPLAVTASSHESRTALTPTPWASRVARRLSRLPRQSDGPGPPAPVVSVELVRASGPASHRRRPALAGTRPSASSTVRDIAARYNNVLALQLELCLPRLLVVSRTRGCVWRFAGFGRNPGRRASPEHRTPFRA
jgi:hypothetical protein